MTRHSFRHIHQRKNISFYNGQILIVKEHLLRGPYVGSYLMIFF